MNSEYKDWGEVSPIFDEINNFKANKNLVDASEAQTRFDIIDRIVREILQWQHGQIKVEERSDLFEKGYVDYILRSRDSIIIIEAKKLGASFPTPTKAKKLKLGGSVLSTKEISAALKQAEQYAISKGAQVVVATNGECWCLYPLFDGIKREDVIATLLFPFTISGHAEELYNMLSCPKVESNGVNHITAEMITLKERRIIQTVRDSDLRLDRNNIADFISPALDDALYNESFINDPEKLKKCFVATDRRTKFDSALNIYLEESKPDTILPARKIKKEKKIDEVHTAISRSLGHIAPPITLIIGEVGCGKSTYLKHFEHVKGENLIHAKKIHWIYVDYEQMGRDGNPREFLYGKLREYLLAEHPENPTDYRSAVEPAYEDEVKALARGPYASLFRYKEKFDEKVIELIDNDFKKVEPYVDKLLGYLSRKTACVLILDNIDLYEDEDLETRVLSEGIALSKKIHCHILISIRDTTFVHHKNDSIFNAHELKKLWLDPPPFKEVLSKRLTYAKKALEGTKVTIPLPNSMNLEVPDLSVLFDIAQKSLLGNESGKLIEYVSGRNIRKGIELVRNFFTSGHVRADLTLKNYLNGRTWLTFPIHEVFKGALLGSWKHYREDRADAFNLFDSKIPSARLLLLRFYLLKFLQIKALDANTTVVKVQELIDFFSKIGVSESDVCFCLNSLLRFSLINSKEAKLITRESSIYITMTGGYYITFLCYQICYHEAMMEDTPIYDDIIFENLSRLSTEMDLEHNIVTRLEIRLKRAELFTSYLQNIETKVLEEVKGNTYLFSFEEIGKRVKREFESIIEQQKHKQLKGHHR